MIHWSAVKFCPPPHTLTPTLGGVYCGSTVLKVRSSEAARIVFHLPSIFIGPNYGTVLAIITFCHQFKKGSGGGGSAVLAPFPPPSSSPTPLTLSQSLNHKVPWLQSPCNLIRAYSRGRTVSKHARWQRDREKLRFDLLNVKKNPSNMMAHFVYEAQFKRRLPN